MKMKKATTFLLSSITIASSMFIVGSGNLANKVSNQNAQAKLLSGVNVSENDEGLKVYNVSSWEEFVNVSNITQDSYRSTNQPEFKVVSFENDIDLGGVDFSKKENHIHTLRNTIIDGNNHSIKNRQFDGETINVNDDLYGSTIEYAYNIQIKDLTFDNDPFAIGYAAFDQNVFNAQNIDNHGNMLDNVVFKNVDMNNNQIIMDPTNLTGYYQSEEWAGANPLDLKQAHFDKDANVMGLFINSITVLHPSNTSAYTSLFNNVTIKNNQVTSNTFKLNDNPNGMFIFAFGIGNITTSFAEQYDPNSNIILNDIYVQNNAFVGNSFAEEKTGGQTMISGFVGNVRSINHALYTEVKTTNSLALFNSFQNLENNNSIFETSLFEGGSYDVLNQDEVRSINSTLYHSSYNYESNTLDAGYENIISVSNFELSQNDQIIGTSKVEGIYKTSTSNLVRSNLSVVNEKVSKQDFLNSYPDAKKGNLTYYQDLSKGSKFDQLVNDFIANQGLEGILYVVYDNQDNISSFKLREQTTLNLSEAFDINQWNTISLNLNPIVGVDSLASSYYLANQGIIENLLNSQTLIEQLVNNSDIFLNFNNGEYVAKGIKTQNSEQLNIKFDINDFVAMKQGTFAKKNLYDILKAQDITLDFYSTNNKSAEKLLSIDLTAGQIVSADAKDITVLPSVNAAITYTLLTLIIVILLALIAIGIISAFKFKRNVAIKKASSNDYAYEQEYDYYDQNYDDQDYYDDQYDYDYDSDNYYDSYDY